MWGKILREADNTFNEQKLKRRRKTIIQLMAISITIMIFLGFCGSIAFNAGYIPITEFMDVKEPDGDADEINIDEHMHKHPEIRKLPFIDKLKYKVYGTNRSIDTVANDYKKMLKNDGFKVLYEGTAYKEEIPFRYYGYLKGFTAVGIVMTSDENITLNYETMVLYTTGSAFDYREILNWYKENVDFLDEINI